MEPDGQERAAPPPRRPARQALRFAIGAAIAAGALYAVVSASGGLADAADALRETDPTWLLAAVAFESLSYLLSAARFRRLAGNEADLGLPRALGITLVAHGLGLLAPAAPAEGIAYQYRELTRRGSPRRRIALTIGFEQWFSTRIFYLVHAINLTVVVATRDFPTDARWPILAVVVILGALVLTAVGAARPRATERLAVIAGALRFWRPRPSVAARRAAGAQLHADAMTVVGPPRRRVRLVAISAGSLLGDALAFWMLLEAVGIHQGFDIALLTVGAGAAAASIPLLPGGLGAVEAAIPAVLAWYGAPFAPALSAALLYRAVGTFLPALGGAASLAILARRRQP